MSETHGEQFNEQQGPEQQPASENIESELEKNKRERREKSIETADEVTKQFMEHVESEGGDWNDENFIQRQGNSVVRGINELFSKKYGFSVPEKSLPAVCTWTNVEEPATYIEHYEYKQGNQKKEIKNVIAVPMINDVLNGNTMGEELAHFYRCHFEPAQAREEIAGEFFGFLGSRLWDKVATEEKLGGWWFLAGHEKQFEANSRKCAFAMSKMVKLSAKLDKILGGTGELSAKDKETRKDWLVHQRGYEWASKIDLDKITDWQKFFSLPNKEVRKRFFTDKPDYSGM